MLRIPAETQNGRTFRLKGQGLPRFKSDERGDLYAKVRVVLPTGLDDEARELARAFIEHGRTATADPRARLTAPARGGRASPPHCSRSAAHQP